MLQSLKPEIRKSKFHHLALYMSNATDKDSIIKNIVERKLLENYLHLGSRKGLIYSTAILNEFLNEELVHGQYVITTTDNSSLSSMSSGQQKRALLAYLFAQNPDYLIIDDVFSNLDVATQAAISQTLTDMSAHTCIVQIIHRKQDILPFIDTVIPIQNIQLQLPISVQNFLHNTQESNQTFATLTPDLFALTQKVTLANPLIAFRQVSVSYGDKKVLKEIDWEINAGEFWQLIGPNGSGKSTILSMITGDNPKAYGQDITLFGRKKGSGETIWEIKKYLGYFSSAMTFRFPRLDSIEKMVLSGFFDSVGLYQKPTELQTKIADNWLKILGLYELRNKPFGFLPLGQQRMVMVARAMVKYPPVLILDEPTAGLDDPNTALFCSLINQIAQQSQTAILYVSHRAEIGLTPQKILTLTPTPEGSVGLVK